jgi:hypothetical protein
MTSQIFQIYFLRTIFVNTAILSQACHHPLCSVSCQVDFFGNNADITDVKGGMIHNIQNLIPTHKADLERAEAVVKAGYPAVEPILGELIEWLQDYNWPVAHILAQFLASIGTPIVPHISRVLRTDDDVWKYWVIALLLRSLPKAAAVGFRPELERLYYTPQPIERNEELNILAQDILVHFGWI